MNWKTSLVTVLVLAIIAIVISQLIPKDEAYQQVFDQVQPFQNDMNNGNEATTPRPQEPAQLTIEGEIVCLPHRNTSGPTTLECAYGLKGDNGYYYALNTVALQTIPPPYEVGEKVRIQGNMEPMTQANSQQWETYNIVGSILVTTFEKI